MSKEEILKYTKNILNATYIEATLLDESGNFIETGLVNKEVIQGLLDLYNKEKAIVDLMAEQLTTPVHNKEWVINYFEEKVK